MGTDLGVLEDLVDSETEEEYESSWKQMCTMCRGFPLFLSYLSTTWLSHKQKFANAWVDTIMHIGTTKTNR